MVDKNLFLYDLAVVAIMKNEEPYVKEWLDYHLLAGVDHFYIYDNDSTPEFKKILQPYIDAGIVTYTFYPGHNRQTESYNDAFKNFRYKCRYMAFMDGDEYILPKSKPTIPEVIDEVLKGRAYAAGLSVNWVMFGSNGLEKADYSRGVLERFTKRANGVNHHVKAVADPRKVRCVESAHFVNFFIGNYSVNENGGITFRHFNEEKTADKIEMHHYHLKSREEYENKIKRGNADNYPARTIQNFIDWDKGQNDVFDDGIIKYRDERRAALIGKGGGYRVTLCTQTN